MRLSRKKIILIAIVVVVCVVTLVSLAVERRRSSPDFIQEYTDIDTGEVVSTAPNRDPESLGSDADLLVLGLPQLQANGITTQQAVLVRHSLEDYKVKNKISANTIKILNPQLNIGSKVIRATLKYSESERTDSIHIALDGNYALTVTIYRGTSDSRLYTSERLDSRITTDSENYSGDGVPPELQP